jgi:hypothetical protein
MNRLKAKEEAAPPAPEKPTKDQNCSLKSAIF